jgi:hypothetical protein
MMEVVIESKRVLIFDGLSRRLMKWMDDMINVLKRCMLVEIHSSCKWIADTPLFIVYCSVRTRMINGCTLLINKSCGKVAVWKLERGEFLKQLDGFNCGPIACLKILEQHSLITTNEVKITYAMNAIHSLVTNEFTWMARDCNRDLLVSVWHPW